jgi:hypothetical protein
VACLLLPASCLHLQASRKAAGCLFAVVCRAVLAVPTETRGLSAVTCLFSAFAGIKEGSGLFVAVSRAGGIIAGILLTFVLSCTWFPRSASAQVRHNLRYMCSYERAVSRE